MSKRLVICGLLLLSPSLVAWGLDHSSPVADAAMNRNFAGLPALLAAGADAGLPQADGSTALHWAVYWNELDAVELLLEAGADPRAATRLGATPLSIAAYSGTPAMVERLLAVGVDPNTPFLSNGETALMVAARAGNLETVRSLLDAGADLEAKDAYRETTALLWAAEENHADVVSLLLARGADPAAASKVTTPPARGGSPSADGAEPPRAANSRGGVTALMVATREEATETINVLLDAGAPINQQAGNGSTALTIALQNGDAATAKLLIGRGADVNLSNLAGWTPLYLAVKARTREIGTVPNPVIDVPALMDVVKLLVEHGADVDARIAANSEVYGATTWLEDQGATALVRAAYCGDLEVIKYLLAHGANPHIPTDDGTTALMALTGVGYGDGFTENIGTPDDTFEALKLLVEAGVPINAANDSGVTALHGAAHKNFVRGIQYLVDHGADLTMISNYTASDGFVRNGSRGQSVLDWATGVMVNGQSSSYKTEAVALVTKLLEEHGVNLERLTTTRGGVHVGQ